MCPRLLSVESSDEWGPDRTSAFKKFSSVLLLLDMARLRKASKKTQSTRERTGRSVGNPRENPKLRNIVRKQLTAPSSKKKLSDYGRYKRNISVNAPETDVPVRKARVGKNARGHVENIAEETTQCRPSSCGYRKRLLNQARQQEPSRLVIWNPETASDSVCKGGCHGAIMSEEEKLLARQAKNVAATKNQRITGSTATKCPLVLLRAQSTSTVDGVCGLKYVPMHFKCLSANARLHFVKEEFRQAAPEEISEEHLTGIAFGKISPYDKTLIMQHFLDAVKTGPEQNYAPLVPSEEHVRELGHARTEFHAQRDRDRADRKKKVAERRRERKRSMLKDKQHRRVEAAAARTAAAQATADTDDIPAQRGPEQGANTD
ncbi:hypothetical protein NEOLEDRAFT_1143419 [Neolentinus lepideus HHB14362 ss-1]|uniref:Uncharacterized protein n=1 Tax=Neolentinus lepideus HHB14362 ss-1 TaxID=1314782 RepID=A0A165MJR2_9AGAM|nr:hypothetical protein NEOLEDRAFT_1143419 [Neolentinus lepideus HHB14362 ss-1]